MQDTNRQTDAVTDKTQEEKQRQLKYKQYRKTKQNTEFLFKVLSILVLLGSTVCFFNLFTFRQYCQRKGIYIISLSSLLIWSLVGFSFSYYSRKFYSKLTHEMFRPIMHPKNKQQNSQYQQSKIQIITKQSFDFIFHTSTSVITFILCRKQQWFPMCVGGVGSCTAIFDSYPNWPQSLNPAVQIFYLFQLGTSIYNLLDMIIFKRQVYKVKDYWQLSFHHIVTLVLIFFSIGYNFVPIGTMVMFVHDSSDAVRAINRVLTDSKYSVEYLKVSKVMHYSYISIWAYMRVLVLPFCLIVSMYEHIPDETKDFHFIAIQHIYLMSLSCGIYFLHSFWLLFLAKGTLKSHQANQRFKQRQQQKLNEQVKDQKDKQVKNQ